MKIFWIVLGSLILAAALWTGINYLLQKLRQKYAEKHGTVVYATVVSIGPVTGWAKRLDLKKIVLRLQEPDADAPREVTLSTRTAPGQKLAAGMRLIVVIDPKKPARVYPAQAESAKRVVITGSREERRMMNAQLRSPGRQPVRMQPVRGPRWRQRHY